MLKHSGSAARLGVDSPDERGGKERTPESGIFLSSYPILKANALETMEILSVICYTNHIIFIAVQAIKRSKLSSHGVPAKRRRTFSFAARLIAS